LGSLSPKAADSFAVLSKIAEDLILFAQSQCQEAHPVAQSGRTAFCAKLLDLLGLLCRLVSCGISNVTIKDLESSRARSLRDRLIDEDQMQLALDVASKCSIETEPVWLRWTTSLLRMAKYEQAHVQYRSFLQPFSERPYSSPDHPPIAEVDALLRALEDAPPIHSHKVQELHRHLTEAVHSDLNSSAEARELTIVPVASIFMSDEKKLNATSTLDIVRFRECTYLVETYGSPIQQIRFLLRHDLLRDACSISTSCNLPPACFVTEIGMHCLNRGLLAVLQSTLVGLEQRDAAVVQGFHLAMCRRLNENKCFRQLYALQIHMGDLLRAGLTCVLLFSQSKDTASRVQNLERARENLQRGLMQFQSVKSAQVRSLPASANRTFDPLDSGRMACLAFGLARHLARLGSATTRSLPIVRVQVVSCV
jgi:zinc finger FYVE domain-containing protein 26